MEDHIHHAKSSNQKTSEFQGGANGADVVLIGSDLESPSKKASKKKYSRKRLKINENMERKGMKWWGW